LAGPALTPELALDYLDELSADIRAAAVLDADWSVAARRGIVGDEDGRVGELARELWDRAIAAGGERVPAQIEVWSGDGVVFSIRSSRWTLAVVADRPSMSSLMFYDLRKVLADLDGEGE
jgi:hypothetical protein